MRWLFCLSGLGLLFACSSGPAAGAEGGACYANGTCNAGLSCLSSLCVNAGTDAAADGSADVSVTDAANDTSSSDGGDGGVDPLGTTCSGTGQGSCPASYECLSLNGGTNPWCSKKCSTSADQCGDGYSGPGKAACFITIQTDNYCGVLCEDDTDGGTCSPGQCNGTCPGTLQCTNPISSGQGVIAKGCQ